MLKYRAVLVGVEEKGHPVQILANYPRDIDEWAKAILPKHPGRVIQIFKVTETLEAILDLDNEGKLKRVPC